MGRSRLMDRAARQGMVLACTTAAVLALAPALSAQQILPAGFSGDIPAESSDGMAVSADAMIFRQSDDTVIAQGNVGINYQGYRIRADQAIYHQQTGRVELVGNVAFVDPDGVEYTSDRVELENEFREGFLQALVVAFPDGSRFTAAEHNFDQGVERIYEDGIYAPCGECIGLHGGPIGWQVRAVRIIADDEDNTIYFEQPTLEILGVPIASLPWLSVSTDFDVELPTVGYADEERGYSVAFAPYRHRVSGGTILLTPTIFSEQGVLLEAEWRQSTENLDYSVYGAGIYQLNPDAYSGLANRDFRGALQTSGVFTATEEWTLGWSATAFTDPGFLPDYDLDSGTARNELFAQYFTRDSFADIRLQHFWDLGNRNDWDAFENAQNALPVTYPNARGDHVIDLDDDMGRITLAGRLLGLSRGRDHTTTHSGQETLRGLEGDKAHAALEASWSNQYVVPGGLAISPYLGMRGDFATYDGASGHGYAPDGQTLLSATPIAALDVRYPLIGRAAGVTNIIEPVAQMVYRGSNESIVGVTNEDSHGAVLDSTDIFSFNRFAGWDRQETGLRANLGGTMQTSFDNGIWLNTTLGQSFHLAGANAFDTDDGTVATVGTGLEGEASYIVAGFDAGWRSDYRFGASVQYDPESGEIPRGLARVDASLRYFDIGADYAFIAADDELGVSHDLHEIGGTLSVPFNYYWRATAGLSWDLTANEFLEASAGLRYDDRFFAFNANTRFRGDTHRSNPGEIRFSAGITLRMPDEDLFSYDHTQSF